MNIQLSEKFTGFVNDCINTGLYQNQAEVIREALRRMIREEKTLNKQPNKETLEAIRELNEGKGKTFSNSEDFYKDLGI